MTVLLCVLAIAAAEPGRPLFDGESLSGWEGDGTHWRVESGAIVGEIPPGETLDHNTWLVWRGGVLRDFDLRLKVKLTGQPTANSGIQFRCQVDSVDHVSGYQADLDTGAVWLGRIYDEHGRALLTERGSRVRIAADGTRNAETFAAAKDYAVLFRQGDWNDYRIVAVGPHVAVYVNGTLFSELRDEQTGEADLAGGLAIQLHSGPETRVAVKDVLLEELPAGSDRLAGLPLADPSFGVDAPAEDVGVVPSEDGKPLNLGFESGTLDGWTATGDAFEGQPVREDGIAGRWPGQVSDKDGEHFIGGYEVVQDAGVGTLTSRPFTAAAPFVSLRFGGGDTPATRVEVLGPVDGEVTPETPVLATFTGRRREQMDRFAVDLRSVQGKRIAVRLVDESRGAWGHLNFDDFRFHDARPAFAAAPAGRSTHSPVLAHLRPNLAGRDASLDRMFVPPGFSVDLVAKEPDVRQPMAFAFDARGRLWVAEGNCYPQKRPEGQGVDRLLIFEDADRDGSFETRTVFADDLNLVSGLQVGHGGVWVGAAPELLFIPDRDGDDRPDGPPEVLLDGFGYADTHETLNSLTWGPDGWLYGNQGVFNRSLVGPPGASDADRTPLSAGVWRYHPVRRAFEVFARGGSNQWGLAFDADGELFMTHCRSFWGGGPTTHVVKGGHYWNQVNAGHAPFVSGPIAGLPEFPNYLLASMRTGHGEGGAGRPGTRAVFGGHAHVGTLIYQADNWPAEYRGHLLTHNLHGHQLNREVSRREGAGFRTLDVGQDAFLCADPTFVGVDLKVGPDGAVYLSDWSDQRHCHNPGVEAWDRSNGRLYRMKFDATYRPADVNYAAASDRELVEAQRHANDWHVVTARVELARRCVGREVDAEALDALRGLFVDEDAALRLRGLWTLAACGLLDTAVVERGLRDPSDVVRAWSVRLASEKLPAAECGTLLADVGDSDRSPIVRRELASAAAALGGDLGRRIIETLATQAENADDPVLPKLIWFAAAPSAAESPQWAEELADKTAVPQLAACLRWYTAKTSDSGRVALVRRIANADDPSHPLRLLAAAVRGQSGLAEPDGWVAVADRLYEAGDPAAREVGAAFRDERLFARLRPVLTDRAVPDAEVAAALDVLAADPSPENLSLYLRLLDRPSLAGRVIPLLRSDRTGRAADRLIAGLQAWPAETAERALDVLTGRPDAAAKLLDALESGRLPKSAVPAFYARKVAQLGDADLTRRLNAAWGRTGGSSEEKRREAAALVKAYSEAPLWAFDAGSGRALFEKNCAACHQSKPGSERIAPRLEGTGSKGIAYLAENVIDPNAVVGADFQARLIVTADGRVVTGLVLSEMDSAVTVKTATAEETIPRGDIEEMTVSPNSLMPEGLLNPLSPRERIELMKYVMGL